MRLWIWRLDSPQSPYEQLLLKRKDSDLKEMKEKMEELNKKYAHSLEERDCALRVGMVVVCNRRTVCKRWTK